MSERKDSPDSDETPDAAKVAAGKKTPEEAAAPKPPPKKPEPKPAPAPKPAPPAPAPAKADTFTSFTDGMKRALGYRE